jgi:hypothetical protein
MVFLILNASLIFAQNDTNILGSLVDAGKYIIGGDFALTAGEENGESYASLTLSPRINYFIIKGLSIQGGIIVNRTSVGGGTASGTTGIGFGPVYIFDFYQPDKSYKGNVYPFIGIIYNIQSLATGVEGDNNKRTALSFSLGTIIMASNQIGLDIQILYNSQSTTINKTNTTYDGWSLSLQSGFQIFF